jgi:cytochrome c oxidase subunit 2
VGLDLTGRHAVRRWSRRAAASAVILLVAVATSSCGGDGVAQWKRLGLPPPASDRAPDVGALWIGAWTAAWIVGFAVWGMILYAVVRYRRRSEEQVPAQNRYNLPIEVLYTVVPFVIIGVLFFYTVQTQDKVLADVENPDHEVLVLGQQWSWSFTYLDEPSLGDGTDVYESGTISEPPTLWLPVDETALFELRSPDVIHSFWVPEFYFKMDVIPGRSNSFTLTPTRIGEFQGRCAEFCGVSHPRMLFTMKVVTRQAFEQHLAELEATDQVGVLTGDLEPTAVPRAGRATPQGAQ